MKVTVKFSNVLWNCAMVTVNEIDCKVSSYSIFFSCTLFFSLQWMIRATKDKDLAGRLLKVSFLATIYGLWMECNWRRFQNKSTDVHIILANMRKNVRCRASLYQNIRPSQTNIVLAIMWRLPTSIFSNYLHHFVMLGDTPSRTICTIL